MEPDFLSYIADFIYTYPALSAYIGGSASVGALIGIKSAVKAHRDWKKPYLSDYNITPKKEKKVIFENSLRFFDDVLNTFEDCKEGIESKILSSEDKNKRIKIDIKNRNESEFSLSRDRTRFSAVNQKPIEFLAYSLFKVIDNNEGKRDQYSNTIDFRIEFESFNGYDDLKNKSNLFIPDFYNVIFESIIPIKFTDVWRNATFGRLYDVNRSSSDFFKLFYYNSINNSSYFYNPSKKECDKLDLKDMKGENNPRDKDWMRTKAELEDIKDFDNKKSNMNMKYVQVPNFIRYDLRIDSRLQEGTSDMSIVLEENFGNTRIIFNYNNLSTQAKFYETILKMKGKFNQYIVGMLEDRKQ
jgi:hypothetical protein